MDIQQYFVSISEAALICSAMLISLALFIAFSSWGFDMFLSVVTSVFNSNLVNALAIILLTSGLFIALDILPLTH